LGRAGEGNAEGSPTGFQHPIRWKDSVEFSDAVNGVPATALVELAVRAVYRRRCLSALLGGAPAVCTADDEFRLRHTGEGTSVSNTQFFLLIGKGRFGQASLRMAPRGFFAGLDTGSGGLRLNRASSISTNMYAITTRATSR